MATWLPYHQPHTTLPLYFNMMRSIHAVPGLGLAVCSNFHSKRIGLFGGMSKLASVQPNGWFHCAMGALPKPKLNVVPPGVACFMENVIVLT